MTRVDAEFLKKFFVDETPSGTVNGSNTAFTLSQTPFDANDAVEIYIDGIKQIYTTDFTVSGTSVTMVTAPALAQSIRAHYVIKRGEN